jgi:hypothetical protein
VAAVVRVLRVVPVRQELEAVQALVPVPAVTQELREQAVVRVPGAVLVLQEPVAAQALVPAVMPELREQAVAQVPELAAMLELPEAVQELVVTQVALRAAPEPEAIREMMAAAPLEVEPEAVVVEPEAVVVQGRAVAPEPVVQPGLAVVVAPVPQPEVRLRQARKAIFWAA